MNRMNWSQLLCDERLFATKYTENAEYDVRTEFQRDVDRILFSSAFRRLQDKTQVMPFPGSDFVHTRLTHSLEVSSVGRSLGKLVGNHIINKLQELDSGKYTVDDFGNIVVAACLAHDIGNPPFGHSGEKAIGKAFKSQIRKIQDLYPELLDSNKHSLNDFIEFEGNAAGFRILTNDHPSGIDGGLKLTHATLAAFTKYPCSSNVDRKFNDIGKSVDKRKSHSKYGFFDREKEIFRIVAEKTGLILLTEDSSNNSWCRHPLAFIVEAADTFTYKIIDLEDAHKMGCISTDVAADLLMRIVNNTTDARCDKEDWKNIKTADEQIGALRSKALNVLIHEAFTVFKDRYEDIMSGRFDLEIPDCVTSKDILKEISKTTRNKFFRHSSVIDVELAGFEVFKGLVEMFVNALLYPKDPQSEKLFLKLPIYLSEAIEKESSFYNKLLYTSDYLSRMTDSFAIDFYRKLKGIELSNY